MGAPSRTREMARVMTSTLASSATEKTTARASMKANLELMKVGGKMASNMVLASGTARRMVQLMKVKLQVDEHMAPASTDAAMVQCMMVHGPTTNGRDLLSLWSHQISQSVSTSCRVPLMPGHFWSQV